ncbi:hypothetical protein B0T18DRAFT_447834 [Schizothecium vesticola]|uniref:Uncharacterized protein n=1 Tax=Schizothecium vesticola TaxID=314040 RepID=A0AA40EPA9_9PEZI|nr:hypothetical protein B0T18DRAFT_447834 [Schizothecium vesticola]
MDTSAPKRRRTSPQSSIPVQPEAEAEAHDAPSNPTTGSPPPDRATAAKKRPSFASPTKASLERHNPEILRRRGSPPKPSRSDKNTALAASRPTSRGSISGPAPRDGSLGQQTAESASRKGKGLDAPGGEESFLRSPARRPAASARPSGIPKPRPLPPPGPEDDDEILNPFARRGLRRSPNPGAPAVEPTIPEPEPEPELPPTPEHPDPVVSTPPSGIHNTPSRRPRRSKALAERLKSSSPLKNVASSPDQPPSLPPKFRLPTKPSKLSQAVHADVTPTPTTTELRGLQPHDPDAPKKKHHDTLLAEIAALEADLVLASAENERLRQSHLSKTVPPPPPNSHAILSLLARHALPPSHDEPPTPSPDAWLLDPLSFLPFTKPTPFPPSTSPDPLPPPTSHHPLPLPAPAALPFLQVFSPLSFTSAISPLPDTDPLLQQHTITATAPRGLFAARVEMTVNTRTSAIVDLSVPRLDPAARAELGAFVEGITTAAAAGGSSATTNNVSVLMWAMGEWVRLATERARVWGVLEGELAGGGEGLRGMVRGMRRRKGKRRGKEDGEEGEEQGKGGVDLLPFMGRTSAEYEVPVLAAEDGERSTLRVQWRTRFDWTGEGRNEIGVLVGVPGRWHKSDDRGRLAGISGLFNELIEGGEDPLTAVRTVACLLAGEQWA